MKRFFIFLFFILLIGCGGGGSKSNNLKTNNNNTNNNNIETALKTGKVDKVSLNELLDNTIKQIDNIKNYQTNLLKAIYQNNPLYYNPGKNSQIIVKLLNNDKAVPILKGEKYILALLGEENNTRYLIFASTPYESFDNNENLSYKKFLNRELLWLISGLPIDTTLKNKSKTIAYFSISNEDSLKNYINSEFPNWELKKCDNYDNLINCIKNSDLIIFSQKDKKYFTSIKKAINFALINQIPLAYFHPNWGTNEISNFVAKKFNFTFPYGGNWWAEDKTDVNSYSEINNNNDLNNIKKVLTHFKNNDYNFDWSQCKNNKGEYGKNYEDCSEVEGLNEEFLNGAKIVKNILNNVDKRKIDMFKRDDFKLYKLLALIGDKIRKQVKFPMDKVKTDDNEFLKSLYADYSVYNYRLINPTQPDMGNFSRSDFSSITPITKTLNLISKKPFRAAGVYVLPGITVKITRLDNNNSVKSYVFVNPLRSASTHEFKKDGYKRPKFLQSAHIEIKPQETIYFTSPYGGPLEIEFDKNDANISLKIENIAQHPVWSEFDNNPDKDENFEKALEENKFDWAELITTSFEVHSKRDKMIESINNFRWGSASKLAQATKIYASSLPMALAGYKGKGIEVIDDIINFAKLKNIPIYKTDFVKHMNADQASCGYGCSGNPYDAYWAFNPISHGDLHEIGHSLERAHFRLKGWEIHSSTNTYAYYSQMRYNMYVQKNNLDKKYYITNSHVPVKVFKEQFNALKKCINEENKTECMKDYWDNSNYQGQSLFIFQAMYQAQKYATDEYNLSNGFHLIGRLHILDRYLDKAKKEDWDKIKNKIGLDTYNFEEAKNISSNDWLVISLSFATGIDYRPFFDMYGEPYSQKASKQIDKFDLNKTTKKEFFVVEKDTGFILPNDKAGAYLNKKSITIDKNSSYPY